MKQWNERTGLSAVMNSLSMALVKHLIYVYICFHALAEHIWQQKRGDVSEWRHVPIRFEANNSH